MSFRSLLFCPDETTARLVTQVLSELDFTVEVARESFAAVERLSEDHFHALVVDCQNEQDAALLLEVQRNYFLLLPEQPTPFNCITYQLG